MGFGRPQVNVGTGERIASVIGGAALLGGGVDMIARRRPWAGGLMALGGGVLLQRGITGHCRAYEALGIRRRDAGRLSTPRTRAISVEECVTINKPQEELYAFWRDFKNLPRIMRHLECVDVVDDRTSHWVAEGPRGELIEWEARITVDRPGELIAWETTDRAAVPNRGSVRFRPASGDLGTIVEVMLEYHPPGGVLGAAVAWLFGREPSQEIRADLKRFKAEMEAMTKGNGRTGVALRP